MQKIGDIPNTRADSNGEFTDGNVAGGVPPTILPAEWFNTIQRELMSVLSAAEIDADSAQFNQVLLSIQKLIGEEIPDIKDASLTQKGIVQLSSATNSTSEALAATPKAVKTVNDAALQKSANLSDLTNKSAARSALELGTAATRDAGTGAGQLMPVGSFGVGGPGQYITPGTDIPPYILNNSGLIFSCAAASGYLGAPDFGGDWFDIIITNPGTGYRTAEARSQSGKVAVMSIDNGVFSGWKNIHISGSPGKSISAGTNVPAHVLNTPGLIFSCGNAAAYNNAPSFFGSEWFDLFQMYHSTNQQTLLALSQNGKAAIGSTTNGTFQGWKEVFTSDTAITTPIGQPFYYALATPPANCLKMNGSSFNTTQYPKLAAFYPTGVLPDHRGEFVRGWDDGRGVNPSQRLLAWAADSYRSHTHRSTVSGGGSGGSYWTYPNAQGGASITDSAVNEVSGGTETRPRSIAYNVLVRAA